jgi:hypothetical protein
LSLKYLRVVLPLVEEQLLHLVNFVFLTGVYPDGWKGSRVVPVAKRTTCVDVSDFRPISILPVLSKVFEVLAKEQILSHVDRCGLVTPFQSGYRAGHSTTTAVLKVVDDLGGQLDLGNVSALVLLDFSKAFDSLDHRRLCSKLEGQFGFAASAAALVRSYLSNRRQLVCVGGARSGFLEVKSGVPQGSILGPILFSLFVNDVQGVLRFASFHLYADDAQVYHSCPAGQVERLSRELSEDLSRVASWSVVNGLRLNVPKTQALFVSRPTMLVDTPRVTLLGSEVGFSQSVVNLGFPLSPSLSWDRMACQVSGRVALTLRRLRGFARLSVQTKLYLFKSLVLPFFNYGDVFLFSVSEESRRALCKSLNDCVRFVFGLRLGDHVTSLQHRLIGCPFAVYYEFRAVVFVHRLLLTRCPEYLYNKLLVSNSHRTRRLVTPRNRTALYNNSFFVQGVRSYNALPDSVKLLPNLEAFKKECLRFYNR